MNVLRDFFYRIPKYLFGISALDTAPQLVKNESLTSAITFLKKKYRFFRPAPVIFLIELYRYLLSTSRSFPIFQTDTSFIIHFCCWGDSYSEKVKNYLLPSLLSDGNLPAIAKQHETTLLIHCDLDAKKKLIASSVMKDIKKYAAVEFLVLPNSLMQSYNANFKNSRSLFLKRLIGIRSNVKYFLLGGLQTQALEIAMKHKAYISFLMPDFVLSNGFLSKILSTIKNKKVVGASAFRTDSRKVSNDLEAFFENKEKTRLAIPANALKELQINHMHPASKRFIVSESTLNFIPCAQLLFETASGFILRAFHYHPVLVNCQQYNYKFKKDYSPIDCNVLNQILTSELPYDQQIEIYNDSSTIAFMELSDEDFNPAPSNNSKKANYHELLKMICEMILKRPDTYDTPLNRYLSSIKNEYESHNLHEKDNFISDDTFFSDLKERLYKT